jgi:hypothetical protein
MAVIMHPTIYNIALMSLCLAATAAATQWLEFDWPDPSKKLDLSTPLSLDYKYSQDEIFDREPELDLLFHYTRNHTEFLFFTEPIIMNYTLTGGQGTVRWDPAELLESIQEEGHFLAAGREHYFEARRHEIGSISGMMFFSEDYAVEADKAVDNAAHLARPVSDLVFLGLGVAAVALLGGCVAWNSYVVRSPAGLGTDGSKRSHNQNRMS